MRRILLAFSLVGSLVWALGCGDGDPARAVGEACTTDGECADGKCHAGMCVAASPLDDGATCTSNAACKSLNCVSGACAAGTSAVGKECLNKEECDSGYCDSGKCALRKDGDACTKAAHCAGGTCYDSKCTSKKDVGGTCTKDDECATAVCYGSKCAKSCTKAADCTSPEVCGSDGKRRLCYKPTYDSNLGTSCAVTGTCSGSLKCLGVKGDSQAVCSGDCKSDMDCPGAMACAKQSSGSSICVPRKACSPCIEDANCPGQHKCVALYGGTETFCARTCTKGSTECPMYAECKDVGGQGYCAHKSGKCYGDGSVCSPCTVTDQCKSGGVCLSLSLTGEQFCGGDCTSSSSACGTTYQCVTVSSSTGLKQCIPKTAGDPPYYTCTSGLAYPFLQKGDVFDDFSMTGYLDDNGDGSLSDEKLAVVKLSDLSSKYKIILFNIMTFW